ncbi:MAG: DNA-binding response regulator [Chloroflexi bacterium RBG_19FT_COMBO_62_14]|nr:MAG: DNA-binding response regulator [Chloroflexi bacterium RBG_19FT_COMBO_62_14]
MSGPSRKAEKILVVDDEATIREVIRRYLERDGFEVMEAADGDAALDVVEEVEPDLVVLDLMLPGLDGLSLTRRLREYSAVPVIMLTAKGAVEDRIEGLELGADDYVVKPFDPKELASRVRAVLRRSKDDAPLPGQLLELGGINLDPNARTVSVRHEPVSMTAKEFDLLWFFMRHPRQVFSRAQVLDHVWGYDFYGDPSTVTVHIRRLREKIERDPSRPDLLQTVWGVGYKFEA